MERGRLERLAPLSGVLFFVLIVVAFVIFPDETPDVDDSKAKVVAFWLKHDDDAQLSAVFWALSTIPLMWFAGSLRSVSREAEGGTGRLSAIAFAGAIVLVAGSAVAANLSFIAGAIADKASPDTLQAVAALTDGFFFPFLVGGALWLFATGLVALRHGALHRVFGWLAIVIAIVSVTPAGFFGFLATIVWVVAVSIALYLRQDSAPGAASAA